MPDYHFFSIGDNLNNTGKYGFVQDKISPSNIEDGLMDNGDILNKMGTSIPTPFARLYLFDSAFAQLNSYQNNSDLKDVAHVGIKDTKGKTMPTAYHFLVSECLDMLEFIYKYGDQKNFDVIEWDVQQECNELMTNGTEAQKELGKSLKDSYKSTALASFTKIYLFIWKIDDKHSIIMGGTSPITLVYTSPNLRRHLRNYGLQTNFTGEAGNVLFDSNKATPLHERSESFREYLHTYWLVELSQQISIKETSFFNYIKDSKAVYDKKLFINPSNPQLSGVKALVASAGQIKTANVNLYCSHNEFDALKCDYIIKPSTDIFKKESKDGAEVDIPYPLVLNKNGVDTYRYASREWNKVTDIIPDLPEEFLSDRTLPGTTFKYPYLTVDDFLESKLIEVSYNINKEWFYTGSETNVKHLLPLKKTFFKFFTIEDVQKIVKISKDPDTEEIRVSLTIPITGGNILLEKVYGDDEKVDCYEESNTFDFALFPSYKIPLTNENDENSYFIILGKTMSVDMDFYKIKNLAAEEGNQKIQNVSIDRRTHDPATGFETRHISVPSSFELIEMTVTDNDGKLFSGMVIPKFKEAPAVTNQFIFSVDFGTTNTHVSYVSRTLAAAAQPVVAANIQAFAIGKSDMQIMTLNDDRGFGYFLKFKTFLQREFVPAEIGTDLKYPLRTTTWEVNTAASSLLMFKNVNIGFNYDKELSVDCNTLPGVYKSNIKWARHTKDVLARDRIREYFIQLLWMMKSKSILNGGGNGFSVIATFPQSMSVPEVQAFKKAWEEAVNNTKVGGNVKFVYESIAPYYSFLGNLHFGTPYMNIDIGGGTTDILHIKPNPGKKDESAVFSAHFAANDIWGDGCNDASDPKKNGFVTFYVGNNGAGACAEYNALDKGRQVELKSVLANANSSADIISYLFAHDSDSNSPTHFGQAIQSSDEMMIVPITHFASLIYYIAYILDLAELKIPSTITFTGMGSKYIQLISSDQIALGKLISKIFSYYGNIANNTELINANVSVMFAKEPKKVTAEGGLIMHSRPSSQNLLPDSCLCYGYDSEEFGSHITYGDITNYKHKVLKEFDKFVNMFKEQSIINAITTLGYSIDRDIDRLLREYASSSFDLMVAQNSEPNNIGIAVDEPMFFWTLKESLYQLSKTAAKNVIGKNMNQ